MNPPTMLTAKVMQNYTICIPKLVREKLKIKKNDRVILAFREDGTVELLKGIRDFKDLVGYGKDVFATLGGGEAFIRSERASWGD